MARKALIVFAKLPVPGDVKTRLTPPLAPDECAALYHAFLFDALDLYRGAELENVEIRLYVDRLEQDWAPKADAHSVHLQKGEELGERMLNAFLETFVAGVEQAVIIGTDHPTLPVSFVAEAFGELETPFTVVLGPSQDGGYYLLGQNEVYATLFNMKYSHSNVFNDTLDRALEAAENVTILPRWYDVDDINSLRRLMAEMRAGAPVGARTRDSLEALLEAHPDLF
ncbi:MAG: TIGR04282 family arsenosugar biosynthesis glycosyltransferase [Rubricoccaceae bacterium]|nr:TIGR04282 family arsenosugar biosynthesis glycosyltransferase [Rubricoccaceae bacterium]